MREILIEELLNNEKEVIFDVRSPIEFEEGAIPGAINIPLFTNEERQEVGIIYKNEGQSRAKWRAMEIVAPKIPIMLQSIREFTPSGISPVIHCWRGGMRSKSVVTFLDFAGISAKRLVGGYKAYRQHILKMLPLTYPDYAVVLHGLTGVGKTEILKNLAKKGFPTIDLEGMAGHRGSIFGTIGIGEGNNQKTFDSLLFKRLSEIKQSSYFIMEAESKRIGRIVQPSELMERKLKGFHFHIHTPVEQRVKHLIQEYVIPFQSQPWFHLKISENMDRIERRLLDNELRNRMKNQLDNFQYADLIKDLLEFYYDPRYDHKKNEYSGDFIDIFAESPQEAADKIEEYLKEYSKIPANQS